MFDAALHFEFLNKLFTEKREMVLPEEDSVYPWKKTEDVRLSVQNDPNWPGSWANVHPRFFEKLKQMGFSPTTIAFLGVGKDAAMIKEAFIFPNLKRVILIDLDEEKVKGAKESLVAMGYDESYFETKSGNAATVLAQFQGKLDWVDAAVFEQHQPKTPPASLPPDAKLSFPTFQKVVQARIDSLKDGGLMTVGDFLLKRWDIMPVRGFENDQAVQELVRQGKLFLHGDKENKLPGLLDLGWRVRECQVLDSEAELIEAISAAGQGRLKLLPEATIFYQVDCQVPDNCLRVNVVAAYLVAAVTLATQGKLEEIERALKAQPENIPLQETAERLRKATNFLWHKGHEHIKALQKPGVSILIPPIVFLAFQKIK